MVDGINGDNGNKIDKFLKKLAGDQKLQKAKITEEQKQALIKYFQEHNKPPKETIPGFHFEHTNGNVPKYGANIGCINTGTNVKYGANTGAHIPNKPPRIGMKYGVNIGTPDKPVWKPSHKINPALLRTGGMQIKYGVNTGARYKLK